MPSNSLSGIIIAASVLVAAGVAIYETNPQLRAWLEESRRKIALALRNLGPDPPNASRREGESEEAREQRRCFEEGLEAEMRRQGWNGEIFQRPGMEGVNMELRRRRANPTSTNPPASRSFDNLLSKDGSLKREHHAASSISSASRGFSHGTSLANPFSDEFELPDEKSQMLFDQDLIGADQDDVLEHEKEAIISRSRESTATIQADEKHDPVVDTSQPTSGPKTFFDNMLQSFMPNAFAQKGDDDFEMQMRKAIEASLHDTHADSSMLDADEDADLKAAIRASLEDARAQDEVSSKGKEPLAALSQPNPWSDSSASATSFHSARRPSDSSSVMPSSATYAPSDPSATTDSQTPEMSQPTQPLTLPIPPTHTGHTEDLYSLTPAGAQTPTSLSFITSPSASHPSSPYSSTFSETFSAFTPSHAASTPSDEPAELALSPVHQPNNANHLTILAISPLGERSEADAMARPEEEMSEVSGWSEVDAGGAGVSTPGDWTDVESEAEGMSEDGGHVQVRNGGQARL